jgi:hypothetical protein
VHRFGIGEEVAVVGDEPSEGGGLGLAERERVRLLVVAVGAQVFDRQLHGRVRLCSTEGLADALRGTTQVVGGVVGAEVGAVPEDRSVLHDPVLEKDPLALAHVPAREEDLAAVVDDPRRNRRLRLVGAVGKEAEDEEADEDDQGDSLDPALRDQELTPSGGRHSAPPPSSARSNLAGMIGIEEPERAGPASA